MTSSTDLVFTPRGLFSFQADVNGQTIQDYKITAPLLNMGVRFYAANAAYGDTVDIYMVDKDNVLGQGGKPDNPTVAAHSARGVFVIPNTLMTMDTAIIAASLVVGLYIRMVYSSTAEVLGIRPNVVVNMMACEQYSDFIRDAG